MVKGLNVIALWYCTLNNIPAKKLKIVTSRLFLCCPGVTPDIGKAIENKTKPIFELCSPLIVTLFKSYFCHGLCRRLKAMACGHPVGR